MTLVSSTNGTLTGKQIWDNGTYLDPATGELKTPVPADVTSISRGFFTPVSQATFQYEGTSFNNFAGQVWDVKWNGCASPTVTVGGTLGTGGTSSFGSNTGTVTLGSSGYSNVSLTFTMTTACRANPPTGITVSQHQYAANVAAGQVWNPDYIADIRQFGALRLMDMMSTNYSGISDSSQLAGLAYNSLGMPFAMAWSQTSSVTSSVLTVGGANTSNGTTWQVGQTLVGTGITNGAVTIASLGTGTGGNGTYNLTCSGACPTISSESIMGIPPVGQNDDFGPKGGISPAVACSLAQATGSIIEYPIPITATNQLVTDIATSFKACGAKVKYSYGNENWNSGFFQFYYVSAQSTANYSGYRAAQIMDIIYNVYGAGSRSLWLGAIGSLSATPATSTAYISGANAAISDGGLHTLTQLFDSVDIAPYFGPFVGGPEVTNVTVGATPTVTAALHGFVNGQVIKMFVSGGTMASVLNNVYATVSSVATNSFVINIATTGLTYASAPSGHNYAMDGTLFKLADQSAALNISTPATYPTKFSYFSQQLASAILNGSASDASYGTVTVPSNGNLTSGGLPLLMQQHALIVNSNGLNLGEYEGGNTSALVGNPQGGPVPSQLLEYLIGFNFDAGVIGDAANNISNLYAVAFQAFRNVNSAYSAQYNDAQPQSQFGPWGSLRFIPGDEGNVKWQALVKENARGPYVDPTPAATWAVNYNSSTDHNFGSGSATTLTCSYTAPSNGLAVVALTWASGASLTSVVIDGGSPMHQDAIGVNPWTAGIFSQAVSSGPHTITATWGTAAPFRSCYALTLTGLSSGVVQAATTGNPQRNATLSEIKGSFIIAVGTLTAASTFATASTPSGTVSGNVTTIDNQVAQASGFAYWSPGPSFTSSIFSCATAAANGIACASYR